MPRIPFPCLRLCQIYTFVFIFLFKSVFLSDILIFSGAKVFIFVSPIDDCVPNSFVPCQFSLGIRRKGYNFISRRKCVYVYTKYFHQHVYIEKVKYFFTRNFELRKISPLSKPNLQFMCNFF